VSRHFTLSEAESLLTQLGADVREAVRLRSEYREAESELAEFARRVAMLGGAIVDRNQMLARRTRRDSAATGLKEAIESIQSHGCLVKDLDMGLIDFPTLYRGEEVYLCWKLDEAGIHFWHGVNEGFRGRKEIDKDFLDNHRGDMPN
jgi:hypothetical protein